ncbi:hypothetical protein ABZ801_09905 [Actinomadura sp. NPDC047616]|uniref:hypothetical protein n=1 Tax=Actinomadura sp. NPDC047616 TaxID=3155914 RepID=UPI0033E20A05
MLQQVTTLLVHEPPLGWDHVQVDYRGMGDYIEAGALLRMTNGALYGAPLPEKVQNLLTRLRAGMYRPGRGTWLHTTYWLDYPTTYQIHYSRHEAPQFCTPPSAEQ